ncbi:unnamed protein product [Darwinula stevensoni]|uniref:G-protein coupled receptors family 2 profile 2 domain-containing protein n=1 Tax=Darwinula stevensoni TaxID=69355 RepID=A0A7R8ZZN4_9CRUS|nr:unnamed protein product [Darwinula stevensoni]CAG0879165.1 unnamed protein product [Darwinula stevensoni]
MMYYVLRVVFHFLVTLPGNWVRSESQKCCPGQDQYGVYDRETGVTKCHVRTTNETIGPPLLPDCEAEVKLVLDQPDPSLLANTPHCHDEFLEGNATFVKAFLLCHAQPDIDPTPVQSQEGINIIIRKCCPLEEGYDLHQQKCVPRPFSWSLPVLNPETMEIRNLSSDQFQIKIDDLSSISCTKDMLLPKKDPRETYNVLYDTGHLYLPASKVTYSPEEFCLDHGRLENGSWIDLARICDRKEKILKECKGKVCVQKCCVETDILNASKEATHPCGPADRLWDSKKHFHPHPPAEVHVITNFPICPGMTEGGILLRPTTNDTFYVTSTGVLMVEKYKAFHVPGYCIDDMMTSNETFEPVAVICYPEASPGKELVYKIYSALLVVSTVFLFITFLLHLILPERKSLHGKTILCYVGCLLVASIALSIARFGTEKDIPDSLCLIAVFTIFYFYLSTFFWLNIISFDIWYSLSELRERIHDQGHEKKVLIRYSLYAFGVPMCIVAIACIVEHAPNIPTSIIKPGINPQIRCWLHGNVHARDTAQLHRSRCQTQKQKFLVYIKLFGVMGLSWVTEVISYFIKEPAVVFMFTDIINILQGFFIFLIFVCKKKTIRYLKRKVHKWFSRHDSMSTSPGSNSGSRGSNQQSIPSSTPDAKIPNTEMNYFNSAFDNSEIPESCPKTTDRSDSTVTKSTDISDTST